MANATCPRTPGPWTALAILAGLNLILFGDVLFNGGGRVLSSEQNDLFLHFSVWRQFALDQLRQGHLPLWNPHYLCGSPFLGNFESALLYPLFWMGIGMGLPLALNLALVSHVLLAGFFTFLWARHRNLSFQGSLLAGIVFMWGGAFYLHLYAGHLPNLTVMAWAPLYFLALDKLLEEEGKSWFFWGVLALSMQILGGHPQYVYFTSILGFLYVLLSPHAKTPRSWVRFFSIYLGAALLTVAQWGPGLEAYLESARRIPMDPDSTKAFSFPPENILTLFLPDLFGNLHSSPYWGRWYLWEVSLFMGLVPSILALVAVFAPQKGKSRMLILVGITFVLSLGAFTPLFVVLERLPGFGGIRGFCKFDFLVALFLALFVGKGWDQLKDGTPPRRLAQWVLSAAVLFFLMAWRINGSLVEGAAGIWGRFFSGLSWLSQTVKAMDPGPRTQYIQTAGEQTIHSLLWAGIFCLLFAVFCLARKWRPSLLYGALFMAILELFLFARANRPTFEFHDLQNRFDQVRVLYQKDPGDYRVYGSADAAMGMGGYDIWEDEPMVPIRYAEFLCRAEGIPENRFFSTAPLFTHFNKVFSLVRLKYLLSWSPKGLEAYPLPFQTFARMSLISQWEVVDESQSLDRLLGKDLDLRGTVLLPKEPGLPAAKGRAEGRVEWKDLSTDSIEIVAEVPKPEILLVTDNYAKGWKAMALADSTQQKYEVVPGDHFLRAIPLNKGRHHFLLAYRPLGFIAGKWVSILSCLLFGAMFLSWRRSSHRPQGQPA